MPLELQNCTDLPLSPAEAEQLWEATRTQRGHSDDLVVVRCVTADESAALNQQYRKKSGPTNILTFSYGNQPARPAKLDGEAVERSREHDIALCREVADSEAISRSTPVRDYYALLLVHAFLHATGLDHEQSAEEAELTTQTEQQILTACGFTAASL